MRDEDLLADPTARLAEMVDFMGCDWVPPFADAVARYRFGSSRAEAFRSDLRPEDVTAMEAAIGPVLGRHGYRTS